MAAAGVLACSMAVALAIPATAAAPASLPGCFGRPGVQFGSHIAYECIFALPGDGILYWSQNKYVFEYYWHPAPGDMVVAEVYFKQSGSTYPGQPNPFTTPLGVPLPPRSNGRIVVLADGCVVAAPVLSPVPTWCLATSQGGQAGEFHQMTPAEQASVSGFWKIMNAATPDRAW